MTTLHPYVRYNDAKCREAFTFYQSILGGKLAFMTAGESPMATEFPEDKKGLIMHAELVNGDIKLYGSDMMRDVAKVGDNFCMSLNYDNEKELRDHFTKLSQGGEVFMAPEKAFWGAIFGMVTDKYGIEWMVNYQMDQKDMKGAKN
ncbi:MAG: VOC family protein [Patescibacteria group bacterium]